MNQYILSICIPSYNRPEEILRLLKSIDYSKPEELEIVITEDNSPKRKEIRKAVDGFKKVSPYKVCYYENEENMGYDHNVRHVASLATGKWVMFMGDDDVFVKIALNEYVSFLKANPDLGYVMRRYISEYNDGAVQDFRYDNKDVFLKPGVDSYVAFFGKSVFISGFCFRKECFSEYGCSEYDGTLLFQLYIEATICLKYSSAYCDKTITKSIEGGTPYFGSSNVEEDLYTKGSNPISNSLNFMKQVKILAQSIDHKNGISSTSRIIESYSKYSYGFLLEHRDDGVKEFTRYAHELKKMGFGCTVYFYLYYFMLLLLGKKGSRKLITFLKKKLGKTPKL